MILKKKNDANDFDCKRTNINDCEKQNNDAKNDSDAKNDNNAKNDNDAKTRTKKTRTIFDARKKDEKRIETFDVSDKRIETNFDDVKKSRKKFDR